MLKVLLFSLFVFTLTYPADAHLSMPMYRQETYRQKVMREGNILNLTVYTVLFVGRWNEFHKITKVQISRFERVDAGQLASSSQPLYDYADQEYNSKLSLVCFKIFC